MELKPIVKYTGGKYKEYDNIKGYLPPIIENYYEPFFGGGGMFFRLHNNNLINKKSYINDISSDLMNFYSMITTDDFKKEISIINKAWLKINEFISDIYDEMYIRFKSCLLDKQDLNTHFNNDLYELISKKIDTYDDILCLNTHCISLKEKIYESYIDKCKRFMNKEITNENDLIDKCIKTPPHQAFYFVIRDMYNSWINTYSNEYTKAEQSAQWFFIRENCWGGMFRYSNGKFNVPYGGNSYNNKCLSCKIESIFSNDMQELFKNKVVIQNADYKKILKNKKFGKNDFIFLDPPYDTTFSEYDMNEYSLEEHKKLAEILSDIDCKWMLIIKKTDFIFNLYKNMSNVNIVEYDKTYTYNARGEYNKNVKHLLIKNY